MTPKEIRKSISNELFIETCSKVSSRRSLIISFNLDPDWGSNVKWANKLIKQLNINTDHWTGQGHLKAKTHNWNNSFHPDQFLIENSTYNRTHLKINLLRRGLLKYQCYICGIREWNGKRITLQIEHVNGIYNDNRLENICLICPNCHSQTPTFCGRNSSNKNIDNKSKCLYCENYTKNKSEVCSLCTAIQISDGFFAS